MRLMNLGVIAITSALLFACTTETTTTEAGSIAPVAAGPAAPAGWRSKLALSRAGGKASAVTTMSRKLGAGQAKVGGVAHRLSSGPGGASCGLSTGEATCDTCLDASCCAQNTACVSNTDCAALIACGDACRDDACISACMSAHPTGAALLDTLSTCVETSCTTACGGPSSPPPTSACGFGSGNSTCDTCLDTSCCGDANACLGDADCTALIDCAMACTDATCEAACEAAHPSGTTKMNALSTCANTACGSTCGGPPPGPGPGPGPGACGLTSGVATCDTCLDASCCGPTTACLGDADCVALIGCYDACTDGACAAACDAAHAAGSSKLTGVFTCAQTSCAATCGL